MLEEIRNKVIFGNMYCGIEHTSINNHNFINVILLKNQKRALHIEKEISVQKIDELKIHINDNQHAYLIINDGKVLSKKVNETLDLFQAVCDYRCPDLFYVF